MRRWRPLPRRRMVWVDTGVESCYSRLAMSSPLLASRSEAGLILHLGLASLCMVVKVGRGSGLGWTNSSS